MVLFHAGFGGMPGGFVGVDVFFVISGYLITGNLLNDLDLGRFSLAGFYERRARRILPALFVMMLGAALGTVMFLPDDLKLLFAESAVAAVLSLSNLFFFRHTGYFDVGAGVSPLLHTWSLAVGGAVLYRLSAPALGGEPAGPRPTRRLGPDARRALGRRRSPSACGRSATTSGRPSICPSIGPGSC